MKKIFFTLISVIIFLSGCSVRELESIISDPPTTTEERSTVVSTSAKPGPEVLSIRLDNKPALFGTSMLEDFEITFDQPVIFEPHAVSLTREYDGLTIYPEIKRTDSRSKIIATVKNLRGDGLSLYGYLEDGVWTIAVDGLKIKSAENVPGKDYYVTTSSYLFDKNGDLFVDGTDFSFLGTTFGLSREDVGFDRSFDFNRDGFVDPTDYSYFGTYFGLGYDATLRAARPTLPTVTSCSDGPVAEFTASVLSGPAPLMVRFSDKSQKDPSNWKWNFGVSDLSKSEERNPLYVFTSPGDYEVSLVVSNTKGSSLKTLRIHVEGYAPQVEFMGADPKEWNFEFKSNFSQYSKYADTFLWNFGDGTTSNEPNPMHYYNKPGNYTVTLIASNAYGSKKLIFPDYIKVKTATTLRSNTWDIILSALEEKSFPMDAQLFTTYSPSTHTYVRNPSVWAKDLGIEAVAAWNLGTASPAAGGALITPQHIVTAEHYGIFVGATIDFVGKNNEVYTRTIVSATSLGNDVLLEKLDSPVPIKPFSILPGNLRTKKFRRSVELPLLGMRTNQFGKVLPVLIDPNQDEGGVGVGAGSIPFLQPWDEYARAGDSGSPVFMRIKDKTVLMTLLTTAGAGTSYGNENVYPILQTKVQQDGQSLSIITEDDLKDLATWGQYYY